MFDIISFGEYQMLQQAFNGLAAIMATDSFLNMMKVGFLVGILSFGARALMTNRWDALPLLTGFIAYSVMFTPKVQVSITDVYGGGVVTVANVPIGLAAPLSVTSHVGRYLSSTFETAFSVITPGSSIQQSGYLEPLTVLLRMRDGSLGAANSDAVGQGNIELSLNEYLVNCVMYDIELRDGSTPEVTMEKIKKAHATIDALKTTFININVRTYLPDEPPQGTVRTCEGAYNALRTYLVTGPWLATYYDKYLNGVIGVPRSPTAGTSEDRVGAALEAIQLSAADARTYMVNALIATQLQRAEEGYAASKDDVAAAITLAPAVEQRNVQWAAEKSLFERIARPVTAFIEVFMVCGAPLMAFAIAAFGPVGLSTLVKFLMMHVWVCLWAPTMAVCNMYIYTVISKWMDHVNATSGMDPISYGGMDALNMELQQWMSVGSMLAAATPTLTLMLIWGSNQVATTLASRMHSSNRVDPAALAPQLATNAPFVQNDSGASGNPVIGYTRTGAAMQTVSYTNSSIFSESSAKSRMESASREAQTAIGRSLMSGIAGVESVSFDQSGRISVTGSSGQTVESVFNTARQAGLSAGMSVSEAQSFAFAVTKNSSWSAGGGVQLGKGAGSEANPSGPPNAPRKAAGGKFGVGFKAERAIAHRIADESGVQNAKVTEALTNMASGVAHNEALSAESSKSAGNTTTKATGWSYNHKHGDVHSRAYADSMAELQQASRQYQTAQQSNMVLGASTSWTAPQLADDLRATFARKGVEWTSGVGNLYSRAFGGDAGRQQAAVNDLMSTPSFDAGTYGMDHQQKVATAKAIVMLTSREANNGLDKAGLFAEIAGVTAADRQKAAGPLPDPSPAARTVAQGVPPQGVVASEVDLKTHLTNRVTDPKGMKASLDTYEAMAPGVVAGARDSAAPRAHFEAGLEKVDQAEREARARVAAAAAAGVQELSREQHEKLMAAVNRPGGFFVGGKQGEGGFSDLRDRVLAGVSMTPEQAEAYAKRYEEMYSGEKRYHKPFDGRRVKKPLPGDMAP